MNLEWYYTFLTVAKYENYRKASEELFSTQTTLFNHIKNLEIFLNIKLFKQIGRNIILTEEGKFFYSVALETIETYEKGLLKIKNIDKYTSNLNVAVTTYIASYLIPKFLPIFFEAAPNINISVSIVDNMLARSVEEGRCDIGIDRQVPNIKSLFYENVCEGKIKLVVPNNAENNKISDELEYLKKYRIFTDNHPIYWENLKDRILELEPKAELVSIESVNATENLIKSNQGISYLPIYIFKDNPSDKIKFINSKFIEDPISFTYVMWKTDTPEINLFLELFSEFVKKDRI